MLFDFVNLVFDLSKLLFEKVCVTSVDTINESLAHWLQRYGLRDKLGDCVKVALAPIETNAQHFKQEWHHKASDHVDNGDELESVLGTRKRK